MSNTRRKERRKAKATNAKDIKVGMEKTLTGTAKAMDFSRVEKAKMVKAKARGI